MDFKQIALKLLTDSENEENDIGEVEIIEGETDIHISKILGSMKYLKSFIPDSKKFEYYTISQEVKDEIKNLIESSVPKTGIEDYKYTILYEEGKTKEDGVCLLSIGMLNKDILKLLEKLEINYKYKTDKDVEEEDDGSTDLFCEVLTRYTVNKDYSEEKINELIHTLIMECKNNKILEIADTDKQESAIVKILEKIDK
jgi:hypothetical protein